MATLAEALTVAIRHHQAGNLQQAELLYREILRENPTHAGALHLLGLIAGQVGRYVVAAQLIRQAIRLKPDFAEAHYNLAIMLEKQDNLEEAIVQFQRAVRLRPSYPEAYYNLGNAFYRQDNAVEAAASYQQALRVKPDYAEAHHNLGAALRRPGQLDQACASYRMALSFKPDYAEAYNSLGNALREQGRLEEAVAAYEQATRIEPGSKSAHLDLGHCLSRLGKLEQALGSYRQAVSRDSGDADAFYGVANALQALGQLGEAELSYQQVLRLRPEDASAHNDLGVALEGQGKLQEAAASYREALCLKPDYAEASFNLGNVHKERGALEEAAASYRHALGLNPELAEAHSGIGMLWLLQGDFEHGWPKYEWRRRARDYQQRAFQQPDWNGAPVRDKTILLYAEQGLGDSLQFVRYAPLVRRRVGRVVLECQRELLPLLEGAAGIDQVIARGDPLPSFDVQAPLLSLPGLLGTRLDTIPANVPYLQADTEFLQKWGQELGPRQHFTIGIAWQGNPKHRADRQRSVPLAQFEALARLDGVRLVSLQKGPGNEQLDAIASRFPVVDPRDRLSTFLDTAAVIMHLDLVVSVDTAVVHLAGALGAPVWVALPFAPDWRWLLDRDDSPWYPSMRLFRQKQPGQWPEVFERITHELRNKVAAAADRATTHGQGQ
jgi:tetratricopeptide (TPR) repeat protein